MQRKPLPARAPATSDATSSDYRCATNWSPHRPTVVETPSVARRNCCAQPGWLRIAKPLSAPREARVAARDATGFRFQDRDYSRQTPFSSKFLLQMVQGLALAVFNGARGDAHRFSRFFNREPLVIMQMNGLSQVGRQPVHTC